jgi:hypothetical protein
VVFDYRIATHNYYSLPLIPMVALTVGAILTTRPGRSRRLLAALMIADAVAILILTWRLEAEPFNPQDQWAQRVSAYREIGNATGHADNTLILAPEMTGAIEYYGEIAGTEWPSLSVLRLYDMAGQPRLTVAQRLGSYMRSGRVRWFVVADALEFDDQPALRDELLGHYPIVARGQKFVVFDLASTRVQPEALMRRISE